MNTREITADMRGVRRFGGVWARDQLLREVSDDDYDKYFIVNTDPASKPGSHWVAVYTGDSPEFSDSLGQSPSTYGKEFQLFLLQHGSRYIYNSKRLQNISSDICGQYCIYYILLREMGYSMGQVAKSFTNDLRMNDEIVKEFYTSL